MRSRVIKKKKTTDTRKLQGCASVFMSVCVSSEGTQCVRYSVQVSLYCTGMEWLQHKQWFKKTATKNCLSLKVPILRGHQGVIEVSPVSYSSSGGGSSSCLGPGSGFAKEGGLCGRGQGGRREVGWVWLRTARTPLIFPPSGKPWTSATPWTWHTKRRGQRSNLPNWRREGKKEEEEEGEVERRGKKCKKETKKDRPDEGLEGSTLGVDAQRDSFALLVLSDEAVDQLWSGDRK